MFHSMLDLPDDLLISVFVRLPHRHMLKCMFVSKAFCAIIRQPNFIRAYCFRNPICLLLSQPGTRSIQCCNFIPSGSGSRFEFFNLKNLSPPHRETEINSTKVTQIINGFLCYYSDNWAVLVNVFSGEVTDLQSPDILSKEKYTRFYLGFDPINCVCKLLCMSYGGFINLEFHILTISGTLKDLSWRKLPPSTQDPSPWTLATHCVSVNGSLYWMESAKQNYKISRIISFDLTTNKFRSFMVNEDIKNGKIEMSGEMGEDPLQLVQFRGKLSVFTRVSRYEIVLHSLELDESNVYNYNWSRHSIILPDEYWSWTWHTARSCVTPIGNLPTGNLLIAHPCPRCSVCTVTHSVTPVYAYNHETNQFMRFDAAKFPDISSGREYESVRFDDANAKFLDISWRDRKDRSLVISTMEQNIDMLDALITRFSPKDSCITDT